MPAPLKTPSRLPLNHPSLEQGTHRIDRSVSHVLADETVNGVKVQSGEESLQGKAREEKGDHWKLAVV